MTGYAVNQYWKQGSGAANGDALLYLAKEHLHVLKTSELDMKERRVCLNIAQQKVQWFKTGSYPHQVTLTGRRETLRKWWKQRRVLVSSGQASKVWKLINLSHNYKNTHIRPVQSQQMKNTVKRHLLTTMQTPANIQFDSLATINKPSPLLWSIYPSLC